MSQYTPEQVELESKRQRSVGNDIADGMLRAYAATLRQQALGVDEAMVERAWKALDDALNGKLDGQEYAYGDPLPMRAALQAALAQHGQPEYAELGNKFVAEAVERLRLLLGELTEDCGPLGIIDTAWARIRRLQSEAAQHGQQGEGAAEYWCYRLASGELRLAKAGTEISIPQPIVETIPLFTRPAARARVPDVELGRALVKRLRDTPNWLRESFGDWKSSVTSYDSAPKEAADYIEAMLAAAPSAESGEVGA